MRGGLGRVRPRTRRLGSAVAGPQAPTASPALILGREPENRSARRTRPFPAIGLSTPRAGIMYDGGHTPASLPSCRRHRRSGALMSDTPVVLFACVHNSGRSVAARVLT